MKKTLKQIINAGKSIAVAGALAFLSGCSSLKTEFKGGIDIGLSYANLNLPKEIQTTPVHPKDGGPSYGGATADIKHGIDFYFPSMNYEASAGTERLKLFAAINPRISWAGINGGGYRGGWYAVELQRTGWGGESYAFTQVYPDIFSYVPSAGLEVLLKEDIVLRVEAGMPHNGFHFKKGHDRWGSWETTDRDTWRGFGKSYGLSLGHSNKESFLGIIGKIEQYEPEFLGKKGDITSYSLGMLVFNKSL